MSGDVQPRKRRDKKKKKDEEELSSHHAPRAPSIQPLDTDDVNIHVHKDAHTGGGICAKLVFFILLSALAVLIGLIITEHRGLTDLDTIERESSFAQYFEGWVDTAPEEHDDHHAVDDHDDDHDDHDDHDEHVEHDEEEEDDHDDHDEEEEHDHDDHDEEEEHDHDEVEEEAASEEEEEEDIEESVQEATEEEEDDEEQVEGSEEADEEEGTQEDEVEDDEGTQEDEEEPSVQNDEDDEEEDQKTEEGDDADDDENVSEAPKTEEDEADDDDAPVSKEEDDNDDEVAEASKEDADDNDDEEEEAGEAKSQEKDDDDGDDQAEDAVEGEDGAEGEGEEQPISVVKAAVGLVILVVAYVVLIRKWKSDEAAEAQGSATKKEVQHQQDLARRNTIVVPPKVEEVELNYDDDYSEGDDEDLEDDEEEEEEYEIQFDTQEKKEYQKLRSTYERSLTPDSDRFDRDDEEPEEGDEDPEEGEEDPEEEEELEPEEEGEYEPEYDDEEVATKEGEEVEEEEPVSEEDDEELLQKLEAKYGKLAAVSPQTGEDVYEEGEGEHDAPYDDEEELDPEEEDDDDGFPWQHHGGAQEASVPEEESWQSAPSYDHENITNADDFAIYDQLDEAQENLNVNTALALSQFDAILKSHPRSPRGVYGRGRALDQLAEKRQSNQLLTDAITNYMKILRSLDGVPSALFKMTGDRCINRLRFMGQYPKAIEVHQLLIQRFPDEITYRNQLSVTYLTTNRMEDARKELQKTLKRWPADGFALVHYGFILKVHDGQLEAAVGYLRRGIASRQEGVIDGRFYFHLGDALARLGRYEEANSVYEDGTTQNVFLSPRQRSLYNIPGLKAQPWWRHEDTPRSYRQFFKQLENNYKSIREEGLAVMKSRGLFQDEAENLRDKGDWKQFELFARGIKHRKNCERCPVTCKLVDTLPEAVGCRRGQVKFSVMLPGTHVWPHCGPTNCRLRAHLGLTVPEKTFIRVDQEIRSWKPGEVMIFDDSFEHEVWHNGSDFRLVLIVDVWHPELTAAQRRSLPAI